MAWRIEVDAGALRDLRGLDRPVARRIVRYLRERLAMADDPRSLGALLRRTAGTGAALLWRYLVGGWRIVARIEDDVLHVLVLRIAHRCEVYR